MNKKVKSGKPIFLLVALGCLGGFCSCKSLPKDKIEPVENFKKESYLGKWYEIGRFDFMWEKNMKNVTANYSLNNDGSIKVVNSGYDYKKDEMKESIGKAKFATKDESIGRLKVSFFGPFYSDYTVIAIDTDYQYALVAGANKKLLWILSRTKTIPEEVMKNYVQIAEKAGYDLSEFVWTIQE